MATPQETVEAYFEAYNAIDMDALSSLVTDDVYVTHHNRGVTVSDKESLMTLYGQFGQAFPDRKFDDRRSITVSGDRVIIEHTWSGTAAGDVPGFAAAGEKASMELCTLITVRDGKVAQYHDYG